MTNYSHQEMLTWLRKRSRKSKAKSQPIIAAIARLVEAVERADRALAGAAASPAAQLVYDPPRAPGYVPEPLPPPPRSPLAFPEEGVVEFTSEQIDDRARELYLLANFSTEIIEHSYWGEIEGWRAQARTSLRLERIARDSYEETRMGEQPRWENLTPAVRHNYIVMARNAR